MATKHTDWPSSTFPENIKALLSHLFELIESQEPDVGQRLATEVFTPDGMTESGMQKFTGAEEISKSRENAWAYISSRKHNVIKVFEGNVTNPGRDIMLQATLELGLKNGNKLVCEFGARAIIVDVEGNGDMVRLKSFVVWTDSAPLRAAIMPEAK